jgi:hypothetical protein
MIPVLMTKGMRKDAQIGQGIGKIHLRICNEEIPDECSMNRIDKKYSGTD